MIAPLLVLRDTLARMRDRAEARLAHLSPGARLWRRRLWRWARTLTAFGATLLFLGAAYFVFIASQGAVDADLEAPPAAAPSGGSLAVAEAARLLALAPDDLGSGALFLPDRHSRRVTLFHDGAVEAVGGFIEVLARRRAADRDLDQAADLMAAPSVDLPETVRRHAEAREALRRYNARLGAAGGRAGDRARDTLAALARAAAAFSAAHEQAVRDAAVRGRFGPADPGAEAAFFRARGHAYAWARLLTAYAADLPERERASLRPALDDALRPLAAAAAFEPRVLFNAPAGSVAPNHLERMATDLAAAVAATRRLDEAASPG